MADLNNENVALKTDIEQEQEIECVEPDANINASPQEPEPVQRSFSRRVSVYVTDYQEKATKEQVACIATYALLLASAPAIAAVIIADSYNKDTSPCNDGTDYVIDLQIYLFVAGAVQLGMSGIYFFTQIVAFLCFSENTWLNIKFCMSTGICRCISSCYPIWHLVWAIIGIYMYAAQMSQECKEEDIGIMILVWCILEFIGTCCISCCICFYVMFLISLSG